MTDRRTAVIAQLAELEAQRVTLLTELLALSTAREEEDRLLTIQDAAGILSVTTDWLYRHAEDFTFTVRPGPGQVRFSHRGIQDYLRRKRR